MLVLVCLPVVAMWIYAYGFATKRATVHIDDRAWTERAESICAVANNQRDELFDPRKIDDVRSDALIERAAIVDQATEILERMLNDDRRRAARRRRPTAPSWPSGRATTAP